MVAQLTALALVLLIHACIAGYVLSANARSISGWRLPRHKAMLGQFAISIFSFLPALVLSVGVSALGLVPPEVSFVLGVIGFILVWGSAQAALVSRLAKRENERFAAPWISRRISSVTFVGVLLCNGAALVIAFGVWGVHERFIGEAEIRADPGVRGVIVRRADAIGAQKVTTGGKEVPASVPVAATTEREKSEVISAINAWVAAWTRKDIAGYLDSYAPEFRVPNGKSRADWEASRRERIGKPRRISVSISTPEIAFVDATTASIGFRQSYESDILSETSRKTLVMKHVEGKWKIIEERSDG